MTCNPILKFNSQTLQLSKEFTTNLSKVSSKNQIVSPIFDTNSHRITLSRAFSLSRDLAITSQQKEWTKQDMIMTEVILNNKSSFN